MNTRKLYTIDRAAVSAESGGVRSDREGGGGGSAVQESFRRENPRNLAPRNCDRLAWVAPDFNDTRSRFLGQS